MKLLPLLRQLIRRILRLDPAEPQDTYSPVRVPVRRGPGGRSATVALEEPIEPTRTDARGRR
jgi:hypothetical protein